MAHCVRIQKILQDKFPLVTRGVCGLMLALCLTAGARAQQDPQQQSDPQQQQQPDPAQPPPDQQPPQTQAAPAPPASPKYARQDADKPPYAKDHGDQDAPNSQAPPPDQYDRAQEEPQRGALPARPINERVPFRPAPATLTIPANTILRVRMNEYLSTDRNQIGDRITATLQQPIVVNGFVVARRAKLSPAKSKRCKRPVIKGTSQLGLELTDLTLVDGQQAPILTELWKASGGTSHGQDAATIGGSTALGAIIGSAADWGRGAAIGAGAGAAAGIGAVLLTRGRPTIIEPETPLTFRLVDPVKVDTTQSQQAFVPVDQQDFDGGRDRGRPRFAGAYPPPYGPAPYACGYYDSCYSYPAYGYPGYGPGFFYPGYVGFGWGPRYYGGFGRGFRR